MDKHLLTVEEASKFLAIKVSTLRAAIFKRQIAYIKIGRLVRFRKEDLLDFLKSNTREARM